MLSYRHVFHAGGHTDIVKHVVLASTLHYASLKLAPIFYLDTHAGAGLYRLGTKEAQKTGEATAGILRLDFQSLLDQIAGPAKATLQLYYETVCPFLERGYYPGSPLLAAHLLRKQDHLHLCELHPTDFKLLRANTQDDRRVRHEQSDGLSRVSALIPPAQKRAVILIDPSFELKEDYRNVVQALSEIYRRMPGAQVLLWYPVVNREITDKLIRDLLNTSIRDLWLFELGVAKDSRGFGLTASGIVSINPPWTLPDQLRSILPALIQNLALENGSWKVENLVKE